MAARVSPSSEPPVERIFPLELLPCILTPFPETLLDESINRGPVCAHLQSIAKTQKDPGIHVLYG